MVEVEFFAAGRDFAEDTGFGQRVKAPAGSPPGEVMTTLTLSAPQTEMKLRMQSFNSGQMFR